jgi:lysophospholipase L1-like esterase
VPRSLLARWALAAVVAVVASLTAAAPAAAQPSRPEPTVDSYVALGDSYTAGPLIPLQTGQPVGCLRSNRNYPSLVAETLRVSEFTDVSCSGARSEHLTGPQDVRFGVNPPQFDALDADVQLVSLGIGGNDIGFAEIFHQCARRSPARPGGAACRDFYTADGRDQLADRIAAAAPQIAAALAEIERRAPAARVLLVGYPAILPDAGPGCFPLIPLTAGDVAYLRETEKRLNAMLAGEAERAGADFVDTYTPTIGHDICQLPGRKWIEGFTPTAPAAPVHPNARGMAAMAGAVLAELADETVLVPAV